jgi:hypothetical protein
VLAVLSVPLPWSVAVEDDQIGPHWEDYRKYLPDPSDGPHIPTLAEVYSTMADMDWGDKVRVWRMKRDLRWMYRKANRAGKAWQWPWPKKS